jgi:hypothetical protein
LVNNLRYTFQRVKEENKKARARQKEQYDKRAKENRYIVGDKVLLDIVVVKTGDSKKFTSKYKGPFRVIKSYDNMTVDIADNSYIQRVHVNRLNPLYENILWKDEKSPSFESTVVGDPHYKSMGTQLAEKEGGEEKEKEKDVNNSSDSDEWESFTSESESDQTGNPLLKTPCNNKKSNKRVGLTNKNETKLKKKNASSKLIEEREKENIGRKNETKERKEREVQRASQRATNRNLRSRHKSVSSPPPTTSLIFHALSTPTQPFHNTRPQKETREKKRENRKELMKQKENEIKEKKSDYMKDRPTRLRRPPIRYGADVEKPDHSKRQ